MFRALLLFQNPSSPTSPTAASATSSKVVMEPPLSVTLLADKDAAQKFEPVELAIERDAVFTTAVGHSSKRTLAVWHVTTPEEVVEHMLHLVRDALPDEEPEDNVPVSSNL